MLQRSVVSRIDPLQSVVKFPSGATLSPFNANVVNQMNSTGLTVGNHALQSQLGSWSPQFSGWQSSNNSNSFTPPKINDKAEWSPVEVTEDRDKSSWLIWVFLAFVGYCFISKKCR